MRGLSSSNGSSPEKDSPMIRVFMRARGYTETGRYTIPSQRMIEYSSAGRWSQGTCQFRGANGAFDQHELRST